MNSISRQTKEVISLLQDDASGDIPKIKLILKLVSSFALKKRPRAFSDTFPNHQASESLLLNPRSYICSNSLLDSLQKKEICKPYSDSREQYHIIYENFITLYRKYIPGGARLINEKPQVFVKHIKQFFLDTYLLTEAFYSAISVLLKNDEWVDVFLFTQCVEKLQYNLFDNFFYVFRGPPKSVQVSLDNQKLVCKDYLVFFCFVDVQGKKTLSQLELGETFKYSFPKMKESELMKKVHDIFMKCNMERRRVKTCVSLDEIIKIIC